jgi:hypothetical protein
MNENHEKYKLMWMELHRTGMRSKQIARDNIGLPYSMHNCDACESTQKYGEKNCRICPIKWVEGKIHTAICQTHKLSPFYKWEHAKTPRTRKKYAKIIANMEWSEIK